MGHPRDRRLHDGGEHRWGDVAVFYRTNAQSRVLEEHLARHGVPYKVIGGTRFYDRREVKDALAYLKAVVNPADEVSVKRVLNNPKRGVGDGSVGKLDAYASAHGLSFMEVLRRAADAGVSGKAATGITQFLFLLDSVDQLAADDRPAPLLEALLERSGYLDELQSRAHHRERGSAGEPGRAGGIGPGRRVGRRSSSSRSASCPTPTRSTATTARSS